MKPFDLEAALNGEPVKLRGGHKAYVEYAMPKDHECLYPLQGYICTPNLNYLNWTIDGAYIVDRVNDKDIIGMWEEPVEMVSINGHEFPKPCKEPPQEKCRYYAITSNCGWFTTLTDYWMATHGDFERLKNSVLHLTLEAAKAHADALNKAHQELVK